MEHHQTVARPHNAGHPRLLGNCLVCIYQFLTSNFNFKTTPNLQNFLFLAQLIHSKPCSAMNKESETAGAREIKAGTPASDLKCTMCVRASTIQPELSSYLASIRSKSRRWF